MDSSGKNIEDEYDGFFIPCYSKPRNRDYRVNVDFLNRQFYNYSNSRFIYSLFLSVVVTFDLNESHNSYSKLVWLLIVKKAYQICHVLSVPGTIRKEPIKINSFKNLCYEN